MSSVKRLERRHDFGNWVQSRNSQKVLMYWMCKLTKYLTFVLFNFLLLCFFTTRCRWWRLRVTRLFCHGFRCFRLFDLGRSTSAFSRAVLTILSTKEIHKINTISLCDSRYWYGASASRLAAYLINWVCNPFWIDLLSLTRMHSSRMRTARLLPVSPSIHCSLGWVYLPGGTPPPVNRILDTRYWKYYLAPTSLRAVIRI